MTYRGRSYSLVVESDRKKMITFKFTCRHLRDLQGYCVIHQDIFFSPRQCVAPIALMDEPPLVRNIDHFGSGAVNKSLPCNLTQRLAGKVNNRLINKIQYLKD